MKDIGCRILREKGYNAVSAQLSSEALLGLIDWEVPGHKIGEIILWSTGW